MCFRREETTCLPVQSILGLYIAGAGVIMSSIAVTISVPVGRDRLHRHTHICKVVIMGRRQGDYMNTHTKICGEVFMLEVRGIKYTQRKAIACAYV